MSPTEMESAIRFFVEKFKDNPEKFFDLLEECQNFFLAHPEIKILPSCIKNQFLESLIKENPTIPEFSEDFRVNAIYRFRIKLDEDYQQRFKDAKFDEKGRMMEYKGSSVVFGEPFPERIIGYLENLSALSIQTRKFKELARGFAEWRKRTIQSPIDVDYYLKWRIAEVCKKDVAGSNIPLLSKVRILMMTRAPITDEMKEIMELTTGSIRRDECRRVVKYISEDGATELRKNYKEAPEKLVENPNREEKIVHYFKVLKQISVNEVAPLTNGEIAFMYNALVSDDDPLKIENIENEIRYLNHEVEESPEIDQSSKIKLMFLLQKPLRELLEQLTENSRMSPDRLVLDDFNRIIKYAMDEFFENPLEREASNQTPLNPIPWAISEIKELLEFIIKKTNGTENFLELETVCQMFKDTKVIRYSVEQICEKAQKYLSENIQNEFHPGYIIQALKKLKIQPSPELLKEIKEKCVCHTDKSNCINHYLLPRWSIGIDKKSKPTDIYFDFLKNFAIEATKSTPTSPIKCEYLAEEFLKIHRNFDTKNSVVDFFKNLTASTLLKEINDDLTRLKIQFLLQIPVLEVQKESFEKLGIIEYNNDQKIKGFLPWDESFELYKPTRKRKWAGSEEGFTEVNSPRRRRLNSDSDGDEMENPEENGENSDDYEDIEDNKLNIEEHVGEELIIVGNARSSEEDDSLDTNSEDSAHFSRNIVSGAVTEPVRQQAFNEYIPYKSGRSSVPEAGCGALTEPVMIDDRTPKRSMSQVNWDNEERTTGGNASKLTASQHHYPQNLQGTTSILEALQTLRTFVATMNDLRLADILQAIDEKRQKYSTQHRVKNEGLLKMMNFAFSTIIKKSNNGRLPMHKVSRGFLEMVENIFSPDFENLKDSLSKLEDEPDFETLNIPFERLFPIFRGLLSGIDQPCNVSNF